MYKSHETGKQGENLAAEYLKNIGYNIIQRNYRCKQGEIDIIAIDPKTYEIVFFEVKTRSNLYYGNPAEAVNNIKQKHIYKTAKFYIYSRKLEHEYLRIDVIEVYLKQENMFKINHIKQVI